MNGSKPEIYFDSETTKSLCPYMPLNSMLLLEVYSTWLNLSYLYFLIISTKYMNEWSLSLSFSLSWSLCCPLLATQDQVSWQPLIKIHVRTHIVMLVLWWKEHNEHDLWVYAEHNCQLSSFFVVLGYWLLAIAI